MISTRTLAAVLAAAALAAGTARAETPQDIARSYAAQAPAAPSPQAGERFFGARHGREWSCATCHGAPPVEQGRHASTGRPIAPLAPVANANRFTDPAKVDKWLRRNCSDVVGRECTPQEKADVVAWLVGVKR